MAELTVQVPDHVAAAAAELGVDLANAVAPYVLDGAEEAVRRAGGGRRKVTVTAVVMAGDSPADVADSYAAVARALLDASVRRDSGRNLVAIRFPLVQLEASSEPFPREPS